MREKATKNFSVDEDCFIRENFRDISDDEIAKILSRPVKSITRRRQRLGCWYVQQVLEPSICGEHWKSLELDGDHYQVSNKGRIKAGKKLAAIFITKTGYCQWRSVNTSKGIMKSFKVHRLVAEKFCHKPDDWDITWHVHHKDGNPQNNTCDNLEWISPEDHRNHHKMN